LKSLVFADITVALSRASYDRFVAEGLGPKSVRLIPPCVSGLSEVSPEERNRLRARHGLPRSVPVWLFPGDLEHGGGAEISLAALAASRERDAVLIMACREKTPRSAPARAGLVEQAKRFGVGDRVRWVGETEDILELVAASDFVLMPSRSPFAKMDYPLVALEAMSLGRPVFVSAGTPAAELADDGGAVAVEPVGEALTGEIQRLSDDRPAREALERSARTLAVERFAPARIAAEYEQLYDELHG
jgi:glycosyltransferase involved in cell wall biosynthesis